MGWVRTGVGGWRAGPFGPGRAPILPAPGSGDKGWKGSGGPGSPSLPTPGDASPELKAPGLLGTYPGVPEPSWSADYPRPSWP